jgi:hypothetical protein
MLNRLLTAGTVAGTTILTPLVGVAPVAAAGADTSEKAETTKGNECVIQASPSGVTRIAEAPMRCYPTLDQALSAQPRGNLVIATHYQGSNGSGKEISFVGPDCSDRWVTSDSWRDTLSSTRVSTTCAGAKHYVNSDCSGAYQIVTPSLCINLNGTLNNNVGCVRYA